MPINANHEYFEAEKKYLGADGLEEKISYLEEMIRKAPKHKGSENLLAELRLRLKKFKAQLEKNKKAGKGKKGIRKEGFQVVLVGMTNSGKSLLLRRLTHATPNVESTVFTTKEPELGTMEYEGVKAQIVDLPSVGSKEFDYGIVNNADCLLVVVNALNWTEELNSAEDILKKSTGKRIVVINQIDKLDENGGRKLEQRVRAKRIKEYVLVSAQTGKGIDSLKNKIISGMGVVRVFTKEPGKPKNEDPIVLKEGATVKDVAESIRKGFAESVKECRLTGPSGKFANQRVGMNHKVKDMDVIEFKS